MKISRKNILKVLKGDRKQSGGFIWKYNIIDTSIDGEIWKEFCEDVLISNLGRVRIKDNNPTYGTLRESGYYDQKIYDINEQRKKSYRVHRLVCLAFLENPDNKPFVNHKDENRSNNKLENLEWITNKENVNYSLDLNNRTKENKRSKIVIQIDQKTGEILNEYKSVSVASKESKIDYNCISFCCRNFRGQVFAGGYKWEYKS